MKDLLEDKDIALKVLKVLNKMSRLPNSGFLAGGAVANTLLLMKYGKGMHNDNLFPINDLDVYKVGDNKDTSGTTPIRTNDLIIKEGYYAGDVDYDESTNYRILSVSRDGLINTITISQVVDIPNNRDYMYILRGFDLNCCQVGIDLETGNIQYTDHFKEFFKTNQLEVTSLYTPGHTAIRLFKKIKELNCYCNIDKCMEIISQPLIPTIRWRLLPRQWGFYFGHKYKDMFIENFSSIKPYFKMVRFFDDKKDLWAQKHKELNGDLLSEDKSHVTHWLNPNNSIPTSLLDKWGEYNDIMWALRPVKYINPNMQIMEKAYLGSSSPVAFINAYQYINGKIKKSLYKKCEMIIENSINLKKIMMINIEFANCDFSLNHIKELDDYCKKEIDFLFSIQKYKLNLQESLTLFKSIKKILNKEGEWLKFVLLDSLKNNNKNIKPTYESLMEDIEEYKSVMSKPLITPLINVHQISLPKEIKIKEILSETEMQWAGIKLKNCINNPSQGYKEKLKSGLVRIFVIMTQQSTSALELHLNSVDSLEVKEHQLLSTCNRKPSRLHRIIADILINNINIHILESNYENKIKLYRSLLELHTGLLVTTSDDNTDNNEEVFGFDNFGEPQVEEQDDFQFDFDDAVPTEIANIREGVEAQVTFEGDVEMETLNNPVREWVRRTITPLPLNYTIHTTLRDNDNPDPDDVWDT